MASTIAYLTLTWLACGESAPPAEAPAPEVPAQGSVEVVDAGLGPNIRIIPELPETQQALEAAGIEVEIAKLVPMRAYDMSITAPDLAAVRTGVLLADVLLTVKTSESDVLVQRLEIIDAGMKRLESGSEVEARIGEQIGSVKTESKTRDELLAGFRDFSREVVSELEWRDQARVVPLIQAGAYLEGAYLIARAMQQAKDRTGGDELLKRGEAVDYFMTFVDGPEGEKVSDEVRSTLQDTLTKLKPVAHKEGALTDEDLATVVSATEQVLGFL